VSAAALADAGGAAEDLDDSSAGEMAARYLGVADALTNRHRFPGHDPEDLRQVARLGLMVAIRRYREGAGVGFVPYAVPTITGMTKRYVRDQSWAVRPPRSAQELRLEVNTARRRLSQELGAEPRRARPRGRASRGEGRRGRAGGRRHGPGPHRTGRFRRAPSQTAKALGFRDSGYEQVEQEHLLATALDGISDQDRRLLDLRFAEGMSQSEIAQILGVSQMQVSRLLMRLLDRMRRKVIGAEQHIPA
jgi:RNA polymerase sigma-B factor